ncbi:MAG: PTS sugar transporter subunit IIA [Microbacteriaceae bacterium]
MSAALPPLPLTAIDVHAPAVDWRAAVRLAGAALGRSRAARPGYAEDMIRMVEDHGPYIVIAPGLALAHARPGPEVLAEGLAVVTLRRPVRFGHPYNDPVSVVVGLAVIDPRRHLSAVAALASVLDDPDAVAALARAQTPEEIQRIVAARG